MKTRILIVDDELDIQSSLSYALKDEGFEVLTASSPREAEGILQKEEIHVGLFDVWFPEGDGMELLQVAREKSPVSSIVMMSGHGNIELALKSIRLGAFDFLEKPLELEKVLVVLNNASEVARLKIENRSLQGNLLGEFAVSETYQSLAKKIEKSFLSTRNPVLFSGEAGVGKFHLARWLHARLGDRSTFSSLSCAAVDESNWQRAFDGDARSGGLLREARGGVLYLSDLERLPSSGQAFLASLLASADFNKKTRVIASTSLTEAEWREHPGLRDDLRAVFSSMTFSLPTLRSLPKEIPEMVESLLKLLAGQHDRPCPRVAPDFISGLQHYPWPGNLRELRNRLEKILLFRDSSDLNEDLSAKDLPLDFPGGARPMNEFLKGLTVPAEGSLRELRSSFETAVLRERLSQCEGNVTRAAESLGIQRSHMHRKLRQYGLEQGELS